MKRAGWILLGVGVASAVGLAILRRCGFAWAEALGVQAYLAPLVVAVVGMILLRVSIARRRAGPAAGEDAEAVEAQLNRLVARLQDINTNSEAYGDVRQVQRVIDDQLAADMNGCVEARESLSRSWGLQPYADFMSRFSEGQRNIHLARTASTQGNAEEVWDNLGYAEARLIEAFQLLKQNRKLTEHPSRN